MLEGLHSNNTVYNDCYTYDISLHQWQTKSSLPSYGRKGCMAFTFNNTIYISAGIDGASNRLIETWKAGNLSSITEINKIEDKIDVYPNPTTNEITVRYNVSCSIYNEATLWLIELSTGKTLLKKNVSCNSNQTEIDLKDFPIGIETVKQTVLFKE